MLSLPLYIKTNRAPDKRDLAKVGRVAVHGSILHHPKVSLQMRLGLVDLAWVF